MSGLDKHDVSPDTVVQSGYVLLRGERDKNGNGRVYHVEFAATVANGASCTDVVNAAAPINRHRPSIDDGRVFDSLVP